MGHGKIGTRAAALALVFAGLGGTAALAASNPPQGGSGYGYSAATCKPGFGKGDTNHCHSGPPGLAHKPAHPAKPTHPAKPSHPVKHTKHHKH